MPTNLPEPFRIIAHRGASGYAPENTMAAFRKARDLGVDEVETDVHFTADGHLVLLHDHDLARTTDGQGPPGRRDLASLKRLDAGGWFGPTCSGERLITLDELLAAFGPAFTYHVELKEEAAGVGAAAAAVIARHGLAARCFVTGFDRDAELRAAKAAAPALRSAVLVSPRVDADAAIRAAADGGHDAVSLYAGRLDANRVAAGRAAGLEVRAWGIRTRQDMERAAAAGCNGMTINRPDWLQAWVAAR